MQISPVRVAFFRIRNAQELTGFSQIRCNDVGILHEAAHFSAQLFRIRRIQPAVVAHDRIDDDNRMGLLELVNKVDDNIDLFQGIHESCGNPVKSQAIFLPAGDVVFHAVRIIVDKIRGKSRVDRQDSRRQRTSLYFQGRYERQFDGNRTAPESRYVIDECNLLLLFHRIASSYAALTIPGQLF